MDRLAAKIEPTLVAVLSDINMPGMDGLEPLGAIKQRRPHLPVMMVTEYGDDERRRRARELGASEFIGCRFILDWMQQREFRQRPISESVQPRLLSECRL